MTNKKKIFLIDFGLGRVFWTRNHHEKQKDINKISGTATYASLNCHKGVSLSRRDDLVSFCYTLIDLALGSLPWSNIIEPDSYKRWKMVEGIKTTTPHSVVCKGLPIEFCSLLDYSTQLTYEECPNYDLLIKMFSALRRPKKPLLEKTHTLNLVDSETSVKEIKHKSLVEQSDYNVLEKTEECSLPEIIQKI